MSRIGRKPVAVPSGVKVLLEDCDVTVEGPKGKLQWRHRPEATVAYDDASKCLRVERTKDDHEGRALHGLTRAMLQNMIVAFCAPAF